MSCATYPDINEILQVPGLLFHNPSAFDVEANWGTKLGFCKDGVFFEPGYKVEEVHQEETGESPYKILYLGSIPRVYVTLRNYNQTALARFFPGLTGSGKVNFPGSIKTGAVISSTYAAGLLFVPDDTVNNPCIYLPNALPHILATAKLAFSHRKEMGFPCVWTGLLGSQAYIGPLSGATI